MGAVFACPKKEKSFYVWQFITSLRENKSLSLLQAQFSVYQLPLTKLSLPNNKKIPVAGKKDFHWSMWIKSL